MPHSVLIVDDDPPLLNLLSAIVRRNRDLDIVTCRDGEEAISELTKRHFDAVLLDLMMPRRNGFDVIEFLRRHRPAQLALVLVLTAASDAFTDRLDPSVVRAVVPKPFEAASLVRLVDQVLATPPTIA